MERRTFLRGLATTLALPSLQSLGQIAHAAEITGDSSPTRLAYIYSPNGVNLDLWRPIGTGVHYKLNRSLKPLEPFQRDIQIIGGLDHQKAKSNGDGPGDHARANATFLTGVQACKTSGKNIELGVSVDQIAARMIGSKTSIPSLELSSDPVRRSGRCDSGYSCAYQYNLAWKDKRTPLPPERHPRRVFEKLFGSGNIKEDQKRRNYQESILDFVLDEANATLRKAGKEDAQVLDAYLTSVREVEKRIEQAEKHANNFPENTQEFGGIPHSYQQHIRVMYDLMALAFQTDTTRVSTFLLAHDGSNRPFPEIGVKNGHHSCSHHRKKPELLADIAKIDTFYATQFAYFLNKLKHTSDGYNNSLLDNSMIVFGGGIADGNKHSHNDLPFILAGHGGGLKAGRHVQAAPNTPMSNVHLALLEKMGASSAQLGDSTGVFKNL